MGNSISDPPVPRRARRPHLLAEEASFVGDDSVGTVKLSGYVRCANTHANLSVNRLVHVPGWGDFQLSHIEGPSSDPHPLQGKRNKTGGDVDMDNGTSTSVLATADPSIQVRPLTQFCWRLIIKNQCKSKDFFSNT